MSPPHLLFGIGLLAIELGTLLLLIAFRLRSEGLLQQKLTRLFLYDAALVIVITRLVSSDFLSRIYMHSSVFYLVAAALLVVTFVAFAEVAGEEWSATCIAGIYMVFVLVFTWGFLCFPLFRVRGPFISRDEYDRAGISAAAGGARCRHRFRAAAI